MTMPMTSAHVVELEEGEKVGYTIVTQGLAKLLQVVPPLSRTVSSARSPSREDSNEKEDATAGEPFGAKALSSGGPRPLESVGEKALDLFTAVVQALLPPRLSRRHAGCEVWTLACRADGTLHSSCARRGKTCIQRKRNWTSSERSVAAIPHPPIHPSPTRLTSSECWCLPAKS